MLIVYLAVAVSFDLRTKRIPNVLIVAGLIAGFNLSISFHGLRAIGTTLGSMVLPILLLYFFFLIHVLGAGDIKLFAVMGLFLGRTQMLQVIVLSFLVGGVFALIKLFREQKLLYRAFVFSDYVKVCLKTRKIRPYKDVDASSLMHFSPAIFTAYIICIAMEYF